MTCWLIVTSVTTPDQTHIAKFKQRRNKYVMGCLIDFSILIVILINKVLSGNAIKNILRTSNNNPFCRAS